MFDVLLFAAALAVVPIWIVRHTLRARQIVRSWAISNGYRVEKYLWTAHSLAPFGFRVSLGKQSVRRVLVRGNDGRNRIAWLLLGDAVVGLLDDRVAEVSWES
jgi:hypothetical protein